MTMRAILRNYWRTELWVCLAATLVVIEQVVR